MDNTLLFILMDQKQIKLKLNTISIVVMVLILDGTNWEEQNFFMEKLIILKFLMNG